jgi:hypothetical protein
VVSANPQYYVLDPLMVCTRPHCNVPFCDHVVLSHMFEGVTDDGQAFHGLFRRQHALSL